MKSSMGSRIQQNLIVSATIACPLITQTLFLSNCHPMQDFTIKNILMALHGLQCAGVLIC